MNLCFFCICTYTVPCCFLYCFCVLFFVNMCSFYFVRYHRRPALMGLRPPPLAACHCSYCNTWWLCCCFLANKFSLSVSLCLSLSLSLFLSLSLSHVINGHSSNTGREHNHQLKHDFAGKGVIFAVLDLWLCCPASFYHFIQICTNHSSPVVRFNTVTQFVSNFLYRVIITPIYYTSFLSLKIMT